MTDLMRKTLRGAAAAAGLTVVVGLPLAAQAQDWRGHDGWRERREWHETYRPYGGYYYAPAPTYYGYSYGPTYGYSYSYPGYSYPGFSLTFRD